MSSNPYNSRSTNTTGQRVPKTFGPSKGMSQKPGEINAGLPEEEEPTTYLSCRIIGAVEVKSQNHGYYFEGSKNGVGKSSLVNCLTGKEFSLDQRSKSYKCNGGNDDAKHVLTGYMPPYYVDGTKYGVRFFEQLDAKNNFLYGQYRTNVIILMYDITKGASLTHLRKQIDEIQQWNKDEQSNMPIILLGNKSDCKHLRDVTYEEGEAFATEMGAYAFYEVSVLENKVEHSKKSLSEVLSQDFVQCYLQDCQFKVEVKEDAKKAQHAAKRSQQAVNMIQIITGHIEAYRTGLSEEVYSEDLFVFDRDRKKEKSQLLFNLKVDLMRLQKDPTVTPEAVRDFIIKSRQDNSNTVLEAGFFSKRTTVLLDKCIAETKQDISESKTPSFT